MRINRECMYLYVRRQEDHIHINITVYNTYFPCKQQKKVTLLFTGHNNIFSDLRVTRTKIHLNNRFANSVLGYR